MTTFIFTITSIENGNFNYNSIEGVYFDVEEAKKNASDAVKTQARIWGVQPTVHTKIKGFMTRIEVKHPTLNIVKIYTLQKVEAA